MSSREEDLIVDKYIRDQQAIYRRDERSYRAKARKSNDPYVRDVLKGLADLCKMLADNAYGIALGDPTVIKRVIGSGYAIGRGDPMKQTTKEVEDESGKRRRAPAKRARR